MNFVVLWASSRCNLHCKYCYADASPKKMDMDFETARKTLDYFAGTPFKIQFTGGEPLLNFNLIQQVSEYVKQKNYQIRFQLQTNATLIDQAMARAIKKMNIACGVSLDGPPEINELLRGGTKEAVQGIQNLAKAGVTVNMTSVLTRQNANKLAELAEFALYLGNVAGIGLDLLRLAGRAKEESKSIQPAGSNELTEALCALYQRCLELSGHFGKRICIREIEEARRMLQSSVTPKAYCHAVNGHSHVVLPEGDVYPCGSLVGNSIYHSGNVHQNENLKPVSLSKSSIDECGSCHLRKFCRGICPSRLIASPKARHDEALLDCVLKKTAHKLIMKETLASGPLKKTNNRI